MMHRINLSRKQQPRLTTATVSVTDVSMKMVERKGYTYVVTFWKSKYQSIPAGMRVVHTANLN